MEGKHGQESGFQLFNGNKIRNLGVGAVMAMFILNQGFSFAISVLDKVMPQSATPVTQSTAIMSSLQSTNSVMATAQTNMEKSAKEIHDVAIYTERLTKAMETLVTLQGQNQADMSKLIRTEKDVLDELDVIKKKIQSR
jgi:hypothetical protein